MSAAIDWAEAADFYIKTSNFKSANSRYSRFASVAEAVRYAIETIEPAALRGVVIEFGDERHEGEAIRALYDAADFPLERAKR